MGNMRETLSRLWRFTRRLAGRFKFWALCALEPDVYDCCVMLAVMLAVAALLVGGVVALTYWGHRWIPL